MYAKMAIQHFCKCFGWVLRKQGEYKRNLDILGFLEVYFSHFVTLTLRNSKRRLRENKSYFLETWNDFRWYRNSRSLYIVYASVYIIYNQDWIEKSLQKNEEFVSFIEWNISWDWISLTSLHDLWVFPTSTRGIFHKLFFHNGWEGQNLAINQSFIYYCYNWYRSTFLACFINADSELN